MSAPAETTVLAVDLGTSAAKLAVLTATGRVLARAEEPYPTRRRSGRIEQDPEDWTRALTRGIAGLPGGYSAASFTGQMQDLVLTAGEAAVRPAVLYSDVRASLENDRLRREQPGWAAALPNEPLGDSLPAKLAWLRAHEPGLRAERLLLGPAGYVAWVLTGRAACDRLTASTTSLTGAGARAWLPGIVEASGWDPAILPELVDPGVVGPVTAERFGLPAGLPVVLDAGDAGATTAGLVGGLGEGYAYVGTSGWYAAVTPGVAEAPWGRVHRLAFGDAETLEIGALASAGAAVAWSVREFFGGDWAHADAALAAVIGDGGTDVLCLPGLDGERSALLGGEAASGTFVGVTSGTTRAELHAAVVTGVAMNLAHVRSAIHPEAAGGAASLPVTGGLTRSAAVVRALAEVLGPLQPVDAGDAPLVSAARTAFRALGISHALPPLASAAPAPVVHPSGVGDASRVARHRDLIERLTGPTRGERPERATGTAGPTA